MELKEQTIQVDSISDKKIEYSGGSFIVREIESAGKKYSIPKTKKDGGLTVAYEKSNKVEVGDKITVAVDEKQKTSKEGRDYTVRTIRDIKGDEHGVPHTSQPIQPKEDRFAELLNRLDEMELNLLKAIEGKKVDKEDINPDDLPF